MQAPPPLPKVAPMVDRRGSGPRRNRSNQSLRRLSQQGSDGLLFGIPEDDDSFSRKAFSEADAHSTRRRLSMGESTCMSMGESTCMDDDDQSVWENMSSASLQELTNVHSKLDEIQYSIAVLKQSGQLNSPQLIQQLKNSLDNLEKQLGTGEESTHSLPAPSASQVIQPPISKRDTKKKKKTSWLKKLTGKLQRAVVRASKTVRRRRTSFPDLDGSAYTFTSVTSAEFWLPTSISCLQLPLTSHRFFLI